MITEEITKQDGTTEKVSHDVMPANLRVPSKELQALLFEAMEKVRAANPDKKDNELGKLIADEKVRVARDFIKEHGMAAACAHPNDVSLAAAEATKKKAPEPKAEAPAETASKDTDEADLRRRYLIAVCNLGNGLFTSLSDEELEDVECIVPQKRWNFNKFKKSLGV